MQLAEHLLALESELINPATRSDPHRLRALLDDSFREYSSSGRAYTKDEVIAALQQQVAPALSISDFALVLLAENVALVTYRSHKVEQHGPPILALRSSIWLHQHDKWRIIFHQGTKLNP